MSLKKTLKEKKFPASLARSLLLASALGVVTLSAVKLKEYQRLLPQTGVIEEVIDGDSMVIGGGKVEVRLIGIDAPDRGVKGYEASKSELSKMVGKKVWLEYDRYQDDQYSRLLAWVWYDCEETPVLTPAEYMRKTKNESNPELTTNPVGCKKGKLLNEELIKKGMVKSVKYSERGPTKYEGRIRAWEK